MSPLVVAAWQQIRGISASASVTTSRSYGPLEHFCGKPDFDFQLAADFQMHRFSEIAVYLSCSCMVKRDMPSRIVMSESLESRGQRVYVYALVVGVGSTTRSGEVCRRTQCTAFE